MMEGEVEGTVARIAIMDLDGLRRFWAKRYGRPPALRSVPIMRMMLAWRVQADAWGGLDEDTCRMLARSGSPRAEGLELGPGARLSRNWKGRSIEVIVEEAGFRWEGRLFRSLTAVASAIAGCHYNGPRFFGLRQQP